MQHIFQVTGMTCGHCERAVEQAVLAVDAQAKISIDRPGQQVVVQMLHLFLESLTLFCKVKSLIPKETILGVGSLN